MAASEKLKISFTQIFNDLSIVKTTSQKHLELNLEAKLKVLRLQK